MIFHRYVFRELGLTFLFTFAVIVAVFLVGSMFQVFRKFDGIGLELLLQIAPLAVGNLLPWVLPIAACAATTFVYGRLAAENEIDAMRLSGIHTSRIIAPAVVFGLLVSVAAWGFLEHAAPAAGAAYRRAMKESVLLLVKAPQSGNQQIRIGPLHLSYVDARDGVMQRIDLMQFGDGRLLAEYQAVSGRAVIEEGKPPVIVLEKPSHLAYDDKGRVAEFVADSDITIPLPVENLSRVEKKPRHMRVPELLYAAATAPHDRARAEILTILYGRIAQSAAPFVLVLVSLPVGLFVRRGSVLAGLGAALPPLVLHFILFSTFNGMGEKGKVDPALAAFLPDAVLLALALVLLRGVYRK